jgi:crossover junction endodeoxyribonuclease RusA
VTWLVSFPAPTVRISLNDRQHWAKKATLTRAWRDTACLAATARRLRGLPPCFMRVTFPVGDNRRRDADNPAPTVKAIQDGLVDAGVWEDDTPAWVETLGSRFEKGADRVVVELIPREDVK